MTAISLPAKPFELAHGSHGGKFEGEACWAELGTILAGEPFGDQCRCMSPYVRRLGIALNDRMNDEERQQLRPFLLRALGTANDGRDEERRQMCNEYLLHTVLPRWLLLAGQKEVAERLSALPADLSIENVQKAVYEARDAAFTARQNARLRLKNHILKELEKRGYKPAAAAGAAADAAAGADVAAVAVADADVAAGAVAAAAAAAAADVAADVAAAAVAAAVADAVAWGDVYRGVRKAVREKIQAKAREILEPGRDERLADALDLMDRMLPEEPPMAPIIPLDVARVICATLIP